MEKGLCSLFLFIAYYIASIVFSFLYTKYNFKSHEIISEIKKELNTSLITYIESKDYCSNGEEVLVLGQWGGTSEGCLCDDKIYKRKCSDKDIKNLCSTIQAKPPIDYAKFNSKRICIKRTEKKYIDYIKSSWYTKNKLPCSYGVFCGVINSLGQYLCVDKNEKCPVNISQISALSSEENFPFDYYSNYLKDQNESILLGALELSQYIPCAYPGQKNWTYYYELEPTSMSCSKKIKNKLNDNRYQYLSGYNTTKYQLYTDNDITAGLNNYDKGKIRDDYVYLYARPLMGFNLKDFTDLSFEKLISLEGHSNRCVLTLEILPLIFLVGIAITVVVHLTIRKVKGKEVLEDRIFIPYMIITLTTSISILITNIVLLYYSVKIWLYFDLKGNDEYTNELFNILSKYARKNFIYSTIVNGIFVFMIILAIISTCFAKNKDK